MNRLKHDLTILTVASALTAFPASVHAGCLDAPDHLDPPDSVLAGFEQSYTYQVAVRSVLLADQPDDPYFRVVVLPAFFPEWALSIATPAAGQARVDVVEARKKIYTAKGNRTPGTLRYSASVDASVAEALRSVLTTVLLDTRHCATSDGRIGFDGETYQFSGFIRNRGVLSGETWSPDDATRAGQLVKAAHLLYRIARAGPDESAELRQELLQVVGKLKAEVLGQGS